MQCPKCGGAVWDNRQKKVSGEFKANAPDFACKKKDGCGWNSYPEKGAPVGYAQTTQPAQMVAPAPPPYTAPPFVPPVAPQAHGGASNGRYAELGDLYWKCFSEVLTTLKQERLVEMFDGGAIAAMVATLFIQRAKG